MDSAKEDSPNDMNMNENCGKKHRFYINKHLQNLIIRKWLRKLEKKEL